MFTSCWPNIGYRQTRLRLLTNSKSCCFAACDAAEHQAFRQPVLIEAAGRFSAAIKSRNRLPAQINYLRFCVYVQP